MSDSPSGYIEKAARFVIFRPTMRIEHEGERKVEDVAVSYPLGKYDPFDSMGSTATIGYDSRRTFSPRRGDTRYVRVWVYNAQGFPAHHCRAFIERIWLNGRIIESERSALHWADVDGAYELPGEMPWKQGNGSYVDVCASDSIDKTLQVISQKGVKGYHRFSESGLYKLELSAECSRPCWRGHLALTVRYDAANWDALHVVSVRSCKRFMGWAWNAN